MGGLFGLVSVDDCVQDVFYGTDYHSHLGTRRGGMAIANGSGYDRVIHDITTSQFRSKFQSDVMRMHGRWGIGYSNEAKVPYERPFVKYTPTWPRSFMLQDQAN